MDDSADITALLQAWRAGRDPGSAALAQAVYRELLQIARRRLRDAPAGATLETAGLVNEAVARLLQAGGDWQSRSHFYALASLQMRAVVIDEARRRLAGKRGGDWQRVTLGEELAETLDDERLLALGEAVDQLSSVEPRTATIVDLHYFAGLSAAEIAACLALGSRTVERELAFARGWLRQRIGPS